MNGDNSKKLLKRFPHLYWQYYLPMTQTCMCWGFEVNDGWFDLIWMLSLAIEDALNLSRWEKYKFKVYIVYWKLTFKLKKLFYSQQQYWKDGKAHEIKLNFIQKWLNVQITILNPRWPKKYKFFTGQVKEKFGTLSYYYVSSEINKIENYINYAEALSGQICDFCGKPGELNNTGWIQCMCQECRKNSE